MTAVNPLQPPIKALYVYKYVSCTTTASKYLFNALCVDDPWPYKVGYLQRDNIDVV